MENRQMIEIREQDMLDLTFWRRGKRRGTHDGTVHRTSHSVFYQGGLLCLQQIWNGTHDPDHLTESENTDYRN